MKNTIPTRTQVNPQDQWDLTTLFVNDQAWETALTQIVPLAQELSTLKGTLVQSSTNLLTALQLLEKLEELSEKVGSYAFLLTATDAANADYQNKQGRYMMAASQASTLTSFINPEIQEIPEAALHDWLKENTFEPYRIYIQKLLHLKPYILSEKEERLFALQTEANQTAQKAFSLLTNVDIDYGKVSTPQGDMPLSQTTWSVFMENPDRNIRENAYKTFYQSYKSHKNTIAALYAGSVYLDIYQAKARGYPSSVEMALYEDKVPLSVYTNLVQTVRQNLAPLHKYYSLRKKILKLDAPGLDLRHYDVYVPLVENASKKTSYTAAVELLGKALSPLGDEYTNTLCQGMLGGWVDRYENKGKRSGAFSAGGYTGYPYILMNYKEDVLRDVFTLAHEGGHSMHSWYSARSNPFMHYNYTIFEAEVASTVNEELLFQYMIKQETDPKIKNYLLCTRAGDILATLYRQTMFAEYELKTHQMVEEGTPLTPDTLCATYAALLTDYFGPEMVFEEESSLECLRIPHFYSAFYVYKYATGISAALSLADRILNGGKTEKDAYFAFLKSGGSRYPIEALQLAGVNMQEKEPIEKAINTFARLVDTIEEQCLFPSISTPCCPPHK